MTGTIPGVAPGEVPPSVARTRRRILPTPARWVALVALVSAVVPAPAGMSRAAGPDPGAPTPAAAGDWSVVFDVDLPGGVHYSSPVIADIDGDGAPEVAVGTLSGHLVVVGPDGAPRPGWPRRVEPVPGTPTAVEAAPTVGDVDADGLPEVVVGAGSTLVPDQPGGLVVFNHDGSVRCRWTGEDRFDVWDPSVGATPDGYPEGVASTPALGDVDGDGRLDIVFGGWDLWVHALDGRTCTELGGFPFWNDDSIWSSPALADIDRDGRDEIFIGVDSTPGGTTDHAGGLLRALDWRASGVVQLWERRTGDVIDSSPVIVDLDGDGTLDVVVGSGHDYLNADSRKVWAWRATDGTPLAGWPVSTGGEVFSSPAVADIDADGRPEVVVGSRDGKVWAFNHDGSLRWSVAPNAPGEGGGPIVASPVLVEVTGDSRPEVVIGNGWGVFVLDGRTGGRVTGPPVWGTSYSNAAAVGTLGGTRMLVVAGTTPGVGGRMTGVRLPAGGTGDPWPMFGGGPTRRAGPLPGRAPRPPWFCSGGDNPPARPSSTSAAGYLLVFADGKVVAHGAATWAGDLSGQGRRVVDAAAAPGGGYWLLEDTGRVQAFGGAPHLGDPSGLNLVAPPRRIVAHPSGAGYWILASDGGVFTYGDPQVVRFWGSMGGRPLNGPVIDMAAHPSGRGYWLLGSDGGVFTFGPKDLVRFRGSMGGRPLAAPVTGIAAHPSGDGYWLMGADGGVFSFGASRYRGSMPGTGLCEPPGTVGIRASATGDGYWMWAADGGVFAFGDAKFHGSTTGRSAPLVALVPVPASQ